MTPISPPHEPGGISRKNLLRAAVAAGAAVPLLATGGMALARDAARSPGTDDSRRPRHATTATT